MVFIGFLFDPHLRVRSMESQSNVAPVFIQVLVDGFPKVAGGYVIARPDEDGVIVNETDVFSSFVEERAQFLEHGDGVPEGVASCCSQER